MSTINPIYPRAIWRVSLDGRDLAERINPRFMEMVIHESRDNEADQLDISLTDHDGMLELPSRNAVIKAAIGWNTEGLIDKGTFVVDEIGYRGTPDVITVRARSANLKGPLRTRTERSFHDKTVKQIVNEIALANSLQAVVGAAFANRTIPHIDQTHESDLAFLTRIGKHYDAVATVKDGKLLFMPIRGAKTASGKDLPIIKIHRRDGDEHDFLIAERDAYTGVKAFWRDPQKQRRHTVIVGVTGNAKHLRATFANESDALAAAQSEWERIRRGLATMRFHTAFGLPELSVQHRVLFPDFKKPISEIEWLAKRLRHSINNRGLTTSMELERMGQSGSSETGQQTIA